MLVVEDVAAVEEVEEPEEAEADCDVEVVVKFFAVVVEWEVLTTTV
ncbi:MAG: hypothetical protein JRN11_05135 [Nitrososphaerota archaeon]|nr:hypothetical protein [Nitrososphaerota archaeon]